MATMIMGIPSDTLITIAIAAGAVILSYYLLFSIGRKTTASQQSAVAAEKCPFLPSKASLDDGNGDTPLQIACGNGDVETARLMLSGAATKGSISESAAPKCPFSFASTTTTPHHAQTVDINAVNFDGETALMFAAENGHDAVVELLVKHSSLLDVGKRNKRGWSAFSLAARAGFLTTVKLLLAAEIPESIVSAKEFEQQQQIKQRLVAVINQQDRNGCTSLIHASGQHHRDVVAFLLEQGADLRLRDLDGVSCLMRALHRGALDISLDLIAAATARLSAAEEEAFLNAQSVDGDSALSISAAFGHVDVVRALLQPAAGVPVQVNHQDTLGFSPVMRAAARGHVEVVDLLLAAGADESLVNIDGKTMHEVTVLLRATDTDTTKVSPVEN